MTISYKWLSEYLPLTVEPERLSKILTSIGLEVESLEKYAEVKGGMQGLIIGEVIECEKHPNADKLSVTRVNVGQPDLLQIVCGAPNVAVSQKVIVAPAGSTIFPFKGEPLTMKVAKIRGVESYGMICAEDEIGLNENHAGILVLPEKVKVGSPAADYFQLYTDWIFEIGLTPNRMDAMSHLGVARDVCAYLCHHDKLDIKVKTPFRNQFNVANNSFPIEVEIENTEACQRYSGLTITNVTVKESPKWLQQKLKAIGQRPINNIVDITNFILHETGQPLHAFNADIIANKKVLVKNLETGTGFISLDGKERKLDAEDLIICDGNSKGMCIAGVYGGYTSGVKDDTKNIFLESAWFNPVSIRKTSFKHGLRTDAATRFEKNTDISNTVNVLKRAAILITELAGGEIASDPIDIYPGKRSKIQSSLKYQFLKKLSGKSYHPDAVKKILESLGFEIVRDGIDELLINVPYSKPDISLQADIVEEIMRIDGLDNILIPSSITISPSVEQFGYKHIWKEKTANYLVGLGFNEIFTNSITNTAYFNETELLSSVKLLNNLSADHNIMRPSMLETGLEAIAYNLNRKNQDLLFFEYGKTYTNRGPSQYSETDHLCLYITGDIQKSSWKSKALAADFYYLKGVVSGIFQLMGLNNTSSAPFSNNKLQNGLRFSIGKDDLAEIGVTQDSELKRFDIKQPVYYADFDWELVLNYVQQKAIKATELPRQLPVHRDLAIIVPTALQYAEVENAVKSVRLEKLQEMKLFDIFESDKLGKDKKSLAINFTFLDADKTLTDKEIDSMMNSIMGTLEKKLTAEIRK